VPKKRYRSKPNREAAVAPRHAGPAREADEATPTDKATQQLAQEREKVRHLEAEVQALRAAAAATHAARLEMQPAAGSAGAPPVPSLWPGHAPTTWWRTLRQTLAAVLFLRGRQALDLPTLVTAFEVDGITGVQQTLDQHGSAAAARARHLLALAKHYQKLNQPGRAAILGRAAYDINPQPTVAKWLAFRLFDAGHIHEPLTLLQGAASTCVFSASEGKRVEEIKTLAKLAQELPAVPAKAEPAYEPTDGALLYVAASCLPYHNSGYTNRTHELNLALKAAGGNVTVVTRPGYPWDRPDRTGLPDRLSTHNEGLDYLHIRTPTLAAPLDEYFAQAANSIARVAKKDRVAAIHAASNYVNALPALIAARQLGLPFAYEMRGLWDMTRAAKIEDHEHSDRYRLGMQLEALVTKEADRVFVISEALGQYIKKEWDVDPAKIALLPNCVNLETMERAKKMAGPKPDVFTVGYAGSLVEYEGLDLLIEALAELKRSGTIVHARIIGDGPEREKLQERAKSRGLNGQVQFLGRLSPDEARTRLAETHVAVLPRRPNAVCRMIPPLKLAESRGLDLPIIVPDFDLFLAELEGCKSSALFTAGDSHSLSSRLAFLAAGRADSATPILSPNRIWRRHAEALLAHARVTPNSTRTTRRAPNEKPDIKLLKKSLSALANSKPRPTLLDVEKVLSRVNQASLSEQDLELLQESFTVSQPRLSALLGWLSWRAHPSAELVGAVRSQLIKLGEMKLPLQFTKEVDARMQTPPELALSRKLQSDINLWQRGFPLPSKAAAPPYEVRPTVLYLLHNSLPYNSGGYATRAQGLLKAINDRGVFNVIGVTRPGYPSDHKAHISTPLPATIPLFDEVDGVRYERCSQSWRRSAATLAEYVDFFALQVQGLAQKHRCCLIHAASNFPNGLAAVLASRRLGVPAIYEVRGLWELTRLSRETSWDQTEHFAFTAAMESQACAAADAVLTLTEGLKELLVQRGTSTGKISILPNAVNPELFRPAERDRDLADSLGIKQNDVVIGYLGSIVAYEGLDDLLRALHLLRKQGMTNIKFLLVGDGAALRDLQALVAELDLQDITIVTGRIPHDCVAGYYSLVDIAAFPRKPLAVCETVSPIKPLEAMCMAKAIIVSSVKALAEMVSHAKTGLVFKSGDVDDLARTLATLLKDGGKRKDLGAAARIWATRERSWATVCHTAENLYTGLALPRSQFSFSGAITRWPTRRTVHHG